MAGHLVSHTVGTPLHGGNVRAPAEVFNSIFEVFLGLGTVVGIVVVTYTLYHAYKYRESASVEDPYEDKVERPRMGEKPTGGKGGQKVFYSFGLSAIIVVSLIAWTYTSIAYIEDGPEIEGEEDITITVEGYRFGWTFIYPNGHETSTLQVPRNRVIRLEVTSRDVFHNFGIPELRVKTDAMPGQTTHAWFTASETGTYQAVCYELCGSGHSVMTADVNVLPQEEYWTWYDETNATSTSANQTNAIGGTGA